MALFKNNNEKFISFNGKKYAFNLERLKEVSLTPSSENGAREIEITQVYEPDGGGDYTISSRVEHETKVSKTPQNDMIVYDFVKLLIISLLENEGVEENFQYDFGTTLAINTLLSWGILEEINE
ncbi:MAG: hypothetical protein J6J23_02105 [Clostridia bacterium]|nr:hypothetical protein [Clostridia bacterium]